MDKTREEFIHFIRQAVTERDSDAYLQLYSFLRHCFIRADHNLDGKVTAKDFDNLIEEAAALPRKYGFAPKAEDMFSCEAERKTTRARMFNHMTRKIDGFITFDQWLNFSLAHITGKVVNTLPKNILCDPGFTKSEFIRFLKKAVDKSKPEYRDLYFFLLKCFSDADRDHDGCVNPIEFDSMIEEASAAPRKFLLAPESTSLYKNGTDRLVKRTAIFMCMDVNKDGTISFDEWLKYAMEHIFRNVADLK